MLQVRQLALSIVIAAVLIIVAVAATLYKSGPWTALYKNASRQGPLTMVSEQNQCIAETTSHGIVFVNCGGFIN